MWPNFMPLTLSPSKTSEVYWYNQQGLQEYAHSYKQLLLPIKCHLTKHTQTHSFVGLALKGLSSVHRSLTFLYLHVRKLSLFLYVWLIYVQYLFQYLFHPANHGFISLASCSHIRLLIVTVADFGKIFISHLVNLALEFYLSLGRIRIRWRCFQNIVDNSSSGCRLLL